MVHAQLQGMSDYPLEQDQGYITMDKFANSEFGEVQIHCEMAHETLVVHSALRPRCLVCNSAAVCGVRT